MFFYRQKIEYEFEYSIVNRCIKFFKITVFGILVFIKRKA